MEKNADKRNKAFSEVKALGYEIIPIDINYATDSWAILEGKKFMPSFRSCKGVGDTAIEEIMKCRPYKTIDDILYLKDGKWKLSKFNKRSLDALIRIGAFESMDIVGPGKTFENYSHMHSCIIPEWSKVKKSLKKNPFEGRDYLRMKTIELHGTETYSRKEIIQNEMNHLGSVNIETVIPPRFSEVFKEKNFKPIDEFDDPRDAYWWIVVQAMKKKTKTGKQYLRLKVMGANGKQEWMNCWGWNGEDDVAPYTVCVGIVSSNHYGKSTKWSKMRIFLG